MSGWPRINPILKSCYLNIKWKRYPLCLCNDDEKVSMLLSECAFTIPIFMLLPSLLVSSLIGSPQSFRVFWRKCLSSFTREFPPRSQSEKSRRKSKHTCAKMILLNHWYRVSPAPPPHTHHFFFFHCVCVSLYICLCLFLCLPAFSLCLYLTVFVCLSVFIYLYIFVCLSTFILN